MYGSASLQLFLKVLVFLRSLGVICYDIWPISEGQKNYLKDKCIQDSQPTFLYLTYLNLKKYGHIIKST